MYAFCIKLKKPAMLYEDIKVICKAGAGLEL